MYRMMWAMASLVVFLTTLAFVMPEPAEVTTHEFATRADTTWYEIQVVHGKKITNIEIAPAK